MGCKGLLESELKLQKLSGHRCVEFNLVSPYSEPKTSRFACAKSSLLRKARHDNALEKEKTAEEKEAERRRRLNGNNRRVS